MIFVLGSGFGLYGHVAALALSGRSVAAPAHYRDRATARPELAQIIDLVDWVGDECAAMAQADMTCLARRPCDNLVMTEQLVSTGAGGTLVLEKPIAPDWQAAQSLERRMLSAGRSWRTPYLFLYCDWFATLADAVAAGRRASVRWHHRQSPSTRSWKSSEDDGGGAANFYFIHWLAVLEALLPGRSMRSVTRQVTDGTEEIGFVAGDESGRLDVGLILGNRLDFTIMVDDELVHQAATPFGSVPQAGVADPRIPVLQRFYDALIEGDDSRFGTDFQTAVTERWRAIKTA